MTFVIEIFGHQIGTVGFTEKVAREKGLDVVSNTITALTTRPGFGGKSLHYKLIADRKTQTLVGAQVISGERVGGIISGLAIAIAEKVPLHKLAQLDTPYSPPVGGDPIRGGLRELADKLG